MLQEERRRFPRYHTPASFTAAGEFSSHGECCLKVIEMSIDGLRFVTEKDVSREAVFSLSFGVTNKRGDAARISALACIRWYVYNKEASLYTAGAQFLGLTQSDRELLKDFFETLEMRSGR
ncbi:MAG: PilZ domain-containing protein [Candidatus Abyssobacteria bacterium SURF_17]|uniref:PilZ domain-containing protein n=1 Tax=Candidatus Abyssobacteria bacterium SURF_17 TaxID=2093361 RepID=A0A419EPM8_9BACT|nr:MAG: PilZ domain-containing protein [Candidatus Abyssubacteria bacterium SURF_17]